MKFFLHFLYSFCFIFLFTQCSYRIDTQVVPPDNLIAKDTFTSILKDIMILENFYDVQQGDKSGLELKISNTAEVIYQNHNVDSARFFSSMDYYGKRQELLREIYISIQDSINLEVAKYGLAVEEE
ncbi:MAG: DUF4296 domain-containing protein [Brumimicrobium sp.]